ncbi:hypothetical protein LJ737_02105 [Hymenobacter sp. 15J16-1T3B]|uniref:hypothetical protein n=1 Tax=Hymenobacter sp. 15J16-1T3B TaxID=2886941 RepID=UPI001D116313|nr:hypothetical protein [Hymenobacter sp. 15J16-1T3B]MCC3156008.1 hypothetical protein [Hymenobacter sp. 15J16-1T3B]
MKTLLLSTKCWGLLCVALFSQLVAHAQLELLTITKSPQTTSTQTIVIPQSATILDNSVQQERNYNAQLIDTTPLPKPPASSLPLIQANVTRKVIQIDSLSSIRDQAKALKQAKEVERIQDVIEYYDRQKTQLVADYERQKAEEAELRRNMTKVQEALKRQIRDIYEDQLSKLRADVTKNSLLLKESLDSHTTEIQKIKQFKDSQTPADSLDKDLTATWYKAYRGFDADVRNLELRLADATASYRDFAKVTSAFASYKIGAIDTSSAQKKEYNQQITNVQRATTDLTLKLDSVRFQLTAYNQKLKDWAESFRSQQAAKAKLAAAASNESNLTALPALTGIKGTGLFIPAVSLIGSRRNGTAESPHMYSLRLFTALGGTDNANDVPSKRGTERLFIADASSFGFSGNAVWAMKYGKRPDAVMGVSFGAAYLDKLMTPDTITHFTSGVATMRAGLECYLIPNVLLLYGGVNSLSFLTNRNQIASHFTDTRPKDVYFYPDAGARAILNVSQKSGVTFLFELGFVVKNNDVRKFVPNDDFVITTLRATLAKNFAL